MQSTLVKSFLPKACSGAPWPKMKSVMGTFFKPPCDNRGQCNPLVLPVRCVLPQICSEPTAELKLEGVGETDEMEDALKQVIPMEIIHHSSSK
eukprot:2427304-Amphidinium_carterae.1